MNVNLSSLLSLYNTWCQEWNYHTKNWPVDPLLLGSCMLLHSGKTKEETEMLLSELSKFMERWLEESHNVIQSNRRKKFARRRREVFMMTFEKSMEAHEIEHVKWQVFLTPQLTGKVQQAYAALSSKDSKNFTKVKEATFKHYGINEEMYYQRFQSAKAKEGESPTKIVTHLTDTVQITHNLNSPCVSHAYHTYGIRVSHADIRCNNARGLLTCVCTRV